MRNFLDSNFFQSLVTLVVGFSAILVFLLTRHFERRDIKNIVLLEVSNLYEETKSLLQNITEIRIIQNKKLFVERHPLIGEELYFRTTSNVTTQKIRLAFKSEKYLTLCRYYKVIKKISELQKELYTIIFSSLNSTTPPQGPTRTSDDIIEEILSLRPRFEDSTNELSHFRCFKKTIKFH